MRARLQRPAHKLRTEKFAEVLEANGKRTGTGRDLPVPIAAQGQVQKCVAWKDLRVLRCDSLWPVRGPIMIPLWPAQGRIWQLWVSEVSAVQLVVSLTHTLLWVWT